MFDTVLVANRGEIALRVMRACRELGLRTVAVYSEADRDAPHVGYADDAYMIGPGPSSESYLHIERIIDVARRSGAGAIHPGYGFLAENSGFAQAVADAGLVFVGPPPEAMERVAGKVEARNEAKAANVPVVPGTLEPLKDVAEVLPLAKEYGYPIAIKAVSGGGGRGLRVVWNDEEIQPAFESARREAEISFKSGALYVEKYLSNPRHIEVQVLADAHGNVVFVGERDCSVQRRHQKLIEESPSPAITPELRAEMGDSAVRLAKSVGYVSAGTMEYLFQDGAFYFLEMNTRIQVEHTVTEMVYGIDLVKAQLRIAQGEPLWFTQADLQPHGHAIECRINAEDPLANFRPAHGTLGDYQEPTGLGVRVDSGVRPGYTIPQFYDSMLAKLITWGQDRTEAIARMRRALADYRVEGLTTVIPFHRAVMEHPTFIGGEFSVNFIPKHPELIEQIALLSETPAEIESAEDSGEPRSFAVEVNGRRFSVRLAEVGGGGTTALNRQTGKPRAATRKGKGKAKAAPQDANGVICPLQGVVVAIRTESGQQVEAGQVLFVIEAMKMENEITAPRAGKIGDIRVQVGASIEAGTMLAKYAE